MSLDEDEDRAVLSSAGIIEVPPGVYLGDRADMEEMYREQLWPRVRTGYKRWRRDVWFNGDGSRLIYRIWDVRESE